MGIDESKNNQQTINEDGVSEDDIVDLCKPLGWTLDEEYEIKRLNVVEGSEYDIVVCIGQLYYRLSASTAARAKLKLVDISLKGENSGLLTL